MEWLAAMCSHIPNRGEQMVRYYGYYSNVSRGKRQKEGRAEAIPCILESQGDEKTFRRNWARLIQKIYKEVLINFPYSSSSDLFDADPKGLRQLLQRCLSQLFFNRFHL